MKQQQKLITFIEFDNLDELLTELVKLKSSGVHGIMHATLEGPDGQEYTGLKLYEKILSDGSSVFDSSLIGGHK